MPSNAACSLQKCPNVQKLCKAKKHQPIIMGYQFSYSHLKIFAILLYMAKAPATGSTSKLISGF